MGKGGGGRERDEKGKREKGGTMGIGRVEGSEEREE